MTQQEIIAGNVLIARFITDEPEVLIKDLQRAGTIEGMHYHDEWDWLMPVCSKMTSGNFDEYPHYADFWDQYCQMDIEQVFKQTVKYIKWHNRNFHHQ